MSTDANPFRTLPPLSRHPVDVGHRTEAAVRDALVRRGYSVLQPLGVNQRYDLVLDDGVASSGSSARPAGFATARSGSAA